MSFEYVVQKIVDKFGSLIHPYSLDPNAVIKLDGIELDRYEYEVIYREILFQKVDEIYIHIPEKNCEVHRERKTYITFSLYPNDTVCYDNVHRKVVNVYVNGFSNVLVDCFHALAKRGIVKHVNVIKGVAWGTVDVHVFKISYNIYRLVEKLVRKVNRLGSQYVYHMYLCRRKREYAMFINTYREKASTIKSLKEFEDLIINFMKDLANRIINFRREVINNMFSFSNNLLRMDRYSHELTPYLKIFTFRYYTDVDYLREHVYLDDVLLDFLTDTNVVLTTTRDRKFLALLIQTGSSAHKVRTSISEFTCPVFVFSSPQKKVKHTGTLYHVVIYFPCRNDNDLVLHRNKYVFDYVRSRLINCLVIRDNNNLFHVLYLHPIDWNKPIDFLDLYCMGVVENYSMYRELINEFDIKLIEQ